MQYLAEKTGHFLANDIAGRAEVFQWLFWQMGGLGLMLGQNLHFGQYSPEKIAYAIDRYVNESRRLFEVIDRQLTNREFITRHGKNHRERQFGSEQEKPICAFRTYSLRAGDN